MAKWMLLLILLFGAGIYFWNSDTLIKKQVETPAVSPETQEIPAAFAKPLEKYYFDNLARQKFNGSEIKLERVLEENEIYTGWLFSFVTEGKKMTGWLNLPKKGGKLPVVVMVRGYVDDWEYQTGVGTKRPAGFFAENGFVTLAPDFLGFGESDPQSSDILEARFECPIGVLDLLASIKNLPQADPNHIFLWGHSNGGQVVLSVLEISGAKIPTTLWAPVSKGFPEAVYQYMGDLNQLEPEAQKVKDRIDKYLAEYDPRQVSIDNFWERIEAPLQIHQGLQDGWIPEEWSDDLAAVLRKRGLNVGYFKYPNSNHQLAQDWDEVVNRDLEFFRKYLR